MNAIAPLPSPASDRHPSAGTCRDAKGFTLTEALVSLVVLTVLGALLSASFLRSRAIAQNAQCVSQLRQCGMAVLSYANDRRGIMESTIGGTIANRFWPNLMYLNGYIAEKKTLRCPIGRATIALTNVAWMWHAYGLNMKLGPSSSINGSLHRLTIRTVESPSTYPLVMDSASPSGVQTFRIDVSNTGMAGRHSGRANVFFLDGHMGTADSEAAQSYNLNFVKD